jgi:hypothetical protein
MDEMLSRLVDMDEHSSHELEGVEERDYPEVLFFHE